MILTDINKPHSEVTPSKHDAEDSTPPRHEYAAPRASEPARERAFEDSEDLFDNMPV